MNYISPAADNPGANTQLPFEHEVATLIVETLQLELAAADILPEDALFHEGLGLDSIDGLELALAVSRRYGVELKSDDVNSLDMFITLRSLCAFLTASRVR